MVMIKVHKAYRRIVAVSDPDLLGKKFVEGKMQIDVNKDFFSGEEFNEDETMEILKAEVAEDSTFNFVGKKAVEVGKKVGIIGKNKEAVIIVKGIPAALSLL